MYIRVFHAKVRPGKRAEFKKALEMLALPNIQYRSGMVAFYPGQPASASSNEFVLVTVWKDASGIEGVKDGEWARAIIPAEALHLVEEWHEHGYKAFGLLDQPARPIFQSL